MKKCRQRRRAPRRSSSRRSNVKNSAITALAGAVAGYACRHVLTDNATLNGHNYARPLALGVVGHLLHKKNAAAGNGVLGAAGFALALEYDDRTRLQKDQGGKSSSLTGKPLPDDANASPPAPAPAGQPLNAEGYVEAAGYGGRYNPPAEQMPIPNFNAGGDDDDDDDAGGDDDDDDDDAGSMVEPGVSIKLPW